MPTSAALKISANSTRRVKWFSKLGYCQESWPFAISLNSVNALGGLITRVRAFVLRVYPTVFIVKEKNANGEKSGKSSLLPRSKSNVLNSIKPSRV